MVENKRWAVSQERQEFMKIGTKIKEHRNVAAVTTGSFISALIVASAASQPAQPPIEVEFGPPAFPGPFAAPTSFNRVQSVECYGATLAMNNLGFRLPIGRRPTVTVNGRPVRGVSMAQMIEDLGVRGAEYRFDAACDRRSKGFRLYIFTAEAHGSDVCYYGSFNIVRGRLVEYRSRRRIGHGGFWLTHRLGEPYRTETLFYANPGQRRKSQAEVTGPACPPVVGRTETSAQ